MKILDSIFKKKSDRCQIILDLGEITPIRFVQYQQWHDVFLAGPTKNVVGRTGNDFPGLYYYNPVTQKEHVLMFNGIIDWRISGLERKVIKIEDSQNIYHLAVGLFSERPIDKSVKMLHWERTRDLEIDIEKTHRDSMPNQWEALEILTRESFRLMSLPLPTQTSEIPDWSLNAHNCLKTLIKKRRFQGYAGTELWIFFETFAGNASTYGLQPVEAYAGTSELIAQAGLASSLLSYSKLKIKNAKDYEQLGKELAETLHNFYDKNTGFFQNTFPPKSEEWTRGVVDTWYTFNNLYHVLNAAHISKNEKLFKLACKALERAIKFVRSCNYQIPLFAKLKTSEGASEYEDGSVIGYAMNPSVLGMYAMILTFAATLLPNKKDEYQKEAILSLGILRRVPLSQMFHQTIQLSWAASACNNLGLTEWRNDFTRCLLLSCYRQGEVAGLFQGCAGLDYPAFRETVEAIIFWGDWINKDPGGLPLRQIIDLVLYKAVKFLAKGSHAGLPNEGLPTLEQPEAGRIGIAIYAAPQVFDLARLERLLK
jgi:hypothetical protein